MPKNEYNGCKGQMPKTKIKKEMSLCQEEMVQVQWEWAQ